MARAYPTQQQDFGPDPQGGDWQALRGELVALLDQVESQVVRARSEDQGYRGISERMRDLRDQVGEGEPDTRHREALRSVKRAVDRFSDRDEGFAPREEGYAPNPRDTLQSAIRQIRDRHREAVPQPRAMEAQRYVEPPRFADQSRYQEPPRPAPEPPRVFDSPRFDELAQAVGGISGRLERLEGDLRSSAKMQTGNVKEIAEQVAQLSHVVELLAGAVGETGQVKRLEAQIAGLAKLVAQGPQVDLSALTHRLDELGTTVGKLFERQHKDGGGVAQRLDDVSSTMGRLADLQVQFANRVDGSTQATASLKDGMTAIEEGVRNIYDRIDTIEKHTALPSVDVDKLTEEMARFTEAMKNPVQPQGLIELVDELNTRIANIESSHRDVGGLKADVEALRTAVIEAVEPRFAAIEMQIEALSDRFGEHRPAEINVGQLEAQVRQLVARMDQTGEQLTGLSRMYQPVEREPAPDFEALADLVAARTSEAVAQNAAPMPTPGGLSDAGIDEIEKRVSRLFQAAAGERPSDDFSGIKNSIGEVNDRLARLEASLVERAKEAERIAALPIEAMIPQPPAPVVPAAAAFVAPEPIAPTPAPGAPVAEDYPPEPTASFPTHDPIAPLLAEAAESAMLEARGDNVSRSDAMPANPSAEAPLTDRPFAEQQSPVKAALEAKNGPRKHHPGLSYEEPDAAAAAAAPIAPPVDFAPAAPLETSTRPEFDPEKVERPPRPVSSFDTPESTFAEPKPASVSAQMAAAPLQVARAPEPQPVEPAPSTNTFIAAARRAAQRPATAKSSSGTGSLIARALATFQAATKPTADDDKAEKPAKALKPAKPVKEKKGRQLAGDKQARTEWTPDDDAVPMPVAPIPTGPSAPEPIALDQEATSPPAHQTAGDSFLSRYRRPILLGAAVVAIALLTLNLISQRLGGEAPATVPPPSTDTSSVEADMTSPLANEPVATMPAAVNTPRIVPIVDSLATASIGPAAGPGFSRDAGMPQMPAAFTVPATDAAKTPAAAAADEVAVAALASGPATEPAEPIASPVRLDMPPESIGPEPLRLAAANGDPRAQFEIAAIYTEGRAVTEDLAEAAVWYERSAAQGFAPAQYRLGNLYENGRGVAKDLTQAKLWYQRAAEAGNRLAMHNLAALYAGGQLGAQEFDSAAEWFEQAALRGMRDSQFNLGMLFARGLGVTQSLEESYRWFALAALRGDVDAAKARDDVARSLDAETVGRLNDEVAAFVPDSIDIASNFAPIGTWSDAFDPGETIGNHDVVKSVQVALIALGYDIGTPDGLAGAKTAEAIRAFERASGMSESGAVNPRLLAVLGSQPV